MKTYEKCYNCKHGGKQFKIDKVTHLHCLHVLHKNSSPWDTLCLFSDRCELHEFKEKKEATNE